MGETNDPSRSPAPYVPPGVITPLPVAIPGAVTPDQLQATQDAQRKISEAASRIAGIDKGLSAAGTATDADYVRTEDRFRDRTHEELYAAVHGNGEGHAGLDAAGLRQLHQTWSECSSSLENLSTFNLLGMNNIFNHGLWRGASGSAAQAASERFAHAANEIGQVFDSVSERLETLSWAAEAVRAAIHPPPTSSVAVSPDPDNPAESLIPGLINPDYQHNLEAQRKTARDEAIRALETLYKPNFPPAGSGVPAYTPVPQVGLGDSVPPGNSHPGDLTAGPYVPGSGNDRGSDGADARAGQPDQQNRQQADPTSAISNQPQTTATNPAGVGLPTSLPGSEATGAQTTAAGLGPATAPDSVSTSRNYGPGFHGGSGLAAGTAHGEAGTSRPGVSGTVGAETSRSLSASARPGATPPGGGGMPHGAGKEKSEEEREHRLPDYLRGIQSEWNEGLDSPVGVIDTDLVTGVPRPDDTDVYNPHQFMRPSAPTPPPFTEAIPDSNYRAAQDPVHSPRPIAPHEQEDVAQTSRQEASFASPPTAAAATGAQPVEPDIAEPSGDKPAEARITPELASLFAEYGWSTNGTSQTDSIVEGGQGSDKEKPSGAGQ